MKQKMVPTKTLVSDVLDILNDYSFAEIGLRAISQARSAHAEQIDAVWHYLTPVDRIIFAYVAGTFYERDPVDGYTYNKNKGRTSGELYNTFHARSSTVYPHMGATRYITNRRKYNGMGYVEHMKQSGLLDAFVASLPEKFGYVPANVDGKSRKVTVNRIWGFGSDLLKLPYLEYSIQTSDNTD